MQCSPLIVAVSSGRDLIGVMCAGEPRIEGVPVGVVAVGHASDARTVLARDPHTVPVLAAGLEHLAQCGRYHTIYVQDRSLQRHELSAVLNTIAGISHRTEAVEVRQTLLLPDSFESFRRALGSHTRRNLMYYRRRAASGGVEFRRGLGSTEVTSALSHLAARQRVSRYSAKQIKTNRTALDDTPGSFWYGLCTNAGVWLSIIGGFQCGETAYITFQLNDSDPVYDHMSLSVVGRSYLIEELIRVGVRNLNFHGGCRGLLERYCAKELWHLVVIEKSTLAATAIRKVGRTILKAGAVRG
jgi:hypothetical protein